MGESPDLYEVLGVPRTATAAEISSAYRRLVRRTHPDVGGSNSLFRMVQLAYETLSDPVRRAEYDRSGSAAPGEETPTSDSGRARGDEPGAGTGDAHPPPPGAGPPPGSPGWSDPGEPGAAAGGPFTGQAGQGPGWQPPPAAPAGGEPGSFLSQRPWIVPVAVGVFLFLVSGIVRGFGVLAFLCLAAGAIAAIGSRRARARIALRSVPAAVIDAMDGTTFEHFCAEILSADGYHVTHMGRPGDYGADLILADHSGRTVVQAKRYSGNVGVDAVQQAVAARGHYSANGAIVLTNSHFTTPARTLAQSNDVALWDRSALFSLAGRASAARAPSAPSLLVMEFWSGVLVIGEYASSVAASASSGRRRRPRRLW